MSRAALATFSARPTSVWISTYAVTLMWTPCFPLFVPSARGRSGDGSLPRRIPAPRPFASGSSGIRAYAASRSRRLRRRAARPRFTAPRGTCGAAVHLWSGEACLERVELLDELARHAVAEPGEVLADAWQLALPRVVVDRERGLDVGGAHVETLEVEILGAGHHADGGIGARRV